MSRLKVLHVVETYLNLTENWVYWQIERVPECEGRVLCREVVNLASFPLAPRRLWLSPPPWRNVGRRLVNSLCFRFGRADGFVELAARLWGAQLLHAHFGTRGWENLPLARRLRRPLVTSFYGYDAWMMPVANPVWRDRFHELFRAGALFLAEGRAMAARLRELGCPEEKLRVHRIGVDLAALPFVRREFRAPLKIVMVGRFIEKKGMSAGLRACALARARHGVDLTLTIIGDAVATDPHGQALKAELQALAQDPALAGRVQFAGFIPLPEMRARLGEHDVFLAPSQHAKDGDAEGGSPVVLTEAMAAGLLCIGTQHCDIPELIRDGQTGYLVAERDVDGLADAIARAARSPESSTTLTAAGRRHVEENYSLTRQLARQRELYAEVAGNSFA